MSKKTLAVYIVILIIILGTVIFLLTKATPSDVQSESLIVSPTPTLTPINMISPTSTPSAETKMDIDPQKTNIVTLKTTMGDIVIELDTKNTPITANNFAHLAKTQFYDKTIFHRTIKGFMIQGGDPNGTGTGGPGYKFADEYLKGSYTRGTVAMANSGPNTNGSQFFIMHADSGLPNNYVIFGHVIEGLDVVDKIATAPTVTNSMGEPSKPVNPASITTAVFTQQ
jgi:cyclophilin family peptidyl-prolyl cis-trans isomerase